MIAPHGTLAKPNDATRDHALRTKAMGLRTSWTPRRNIVVVCRACNREKGDRSLAIWLADLRADGDFRVDRVASVLSELSTPIYADNEST